MNQDTFELLLQDLFVQPAVPDSLEPEEVMQSLAAAQTTRRPCAKMVNIAAAVILVGALAVFGAYTLHRKSLADKPDESLADEMVLTQAEEDSLMMQADLALDDAARKTTAADAPSTRQGCLSGCTEEYCLPECPNYDGE